MKLWGIFIVLSICLLTIGCGGASAPPLDLPAPVTGQIEISPPDAEGKSTVTGSEGAVEGGAIVMVINENLETASSESPLLRMLDAVIPTAYAQTTLPAVCDEPGHWCVIANSDGSFQLIIDAAIGDSIVIVLIDQWGNERSPRVTMIVPSSEQSNIQVNCAGESVSGALVDITNPSVKLLLYEGSSEKPNVLIVEQTDGTQTPIDLPGCYAKGVIGIPFTSGDGRVVVISSEDKILWVATAQDGALVSANTFELPYKPVAIAPIAEENYVAIVFDTGSVFTINRVSLTDGSLVTGINIPDPSVPTISSFDRIIAMTSIGPFADGSVLVAILGANAINDHYLVYINITTMLDLTQGSPMYLGLFLDHGGTDFIADNITDIDFVLNVNKIVHLALVNRGEFFLHTRALAYGGTPIGLTNPLNSIVYIEFDNLAEGTKDFDKSGGAPLKKIAATHDSTGDATAYVLLDASQVWQLKSFIYITAAIETYLTIPGGVVPEFIAADAGIDSPVIVGGGTASGVIDITP